VIVFILDLFCINNQYNGESYAYSNNLQTVKQTSLYMHCYATSSPNSPHLSICIDQAFSSGLATRDSPNTKVQTTQQHLCRTPVGGQVALADKVRAKVDAIPLGIPTTRFAWHRLRIRRDPMAYDYPIEGWTSPVCAKTLTWERLLSS